MNFSLSNLAAGFVFGVFGVYFLRIAKREANIAGLFISLGLLIYPYFIDNTYLVWGIGSVLTFFAYRTI